ncbi:MAG: MFS transporter [Microbacteriaceae bacterium]|jgi:MFS family permease
MTATESGDERQIRIRIRRTLVAGQILAGLGIGATLTIGSLLAEHIAGSESYAGLAATMSTLGSALAAIPLAALAARRGRRVALATGALLAVAGAGVIIVASALMSLPLLLVGLVGMGVAGAVNLQARFAATDRAPAEHRGRDLSLVVWATTIGAVAGPNLNGLGIAIGDSIGMPHLTGAFILTTAAQLAAATIYWVWLKPEPLDLTVPPLPRKQRGRVPVSAETAMGIAVIGFGHATMVAVMAMTPVHLVHHGATVAESSFVISLHVAGMYAFSPVFGAASDRFGRIPVMIAGQLVMLSSLIITATMSLDNLWVTIGLFLLGFGWSANTVAGATLVAESAAPLHKTTIQGRSDMMMSASGAFAGLLAGPGLAMVGYSGLSISAMFFVGGALALIHLIRVSRRNKRVDA